MTIKPKDIKKLRKCLLCDLKFKLIQDGITGGLTNEEIAFYANAETYDEAKDLYGAIVNDLPLEEIKTMVNAGYSIDKIYLVSSYVSLGINNITDNYHKYIDPSLSKDQIRFLMDRLMMYDDERAIEYYFNSFLNNIELDYFVKKIEL